MSNLTRTADYLSEALTALGFVIMSKKSGEGLPLVAFRLQDVEEGAERNYDEFALAHKLRARGWVVPAYTMAPHTNDLKMLRVVVREDFTKNRCDALISDIRYCQQLLDQLDKESIRKQEEFIRKHAMNSGQAKHNHPRFRVSFLLHSIQCSLSRIDCLIYSWFCTNTRQTEREALHPGEARQDAFYLLVSA